MAISDIGVFFPPDTSLCVANQPADCIITDQMISFLNITGYESYFQAYCLSPPQHDGCPFGFCPNSDIGGPLVRISAYITNLLTAILIFYGHKKLQQSMWSQILNVYSLLITCAISIILKQLTKIHAIIAITTAGSPVSLYLVFYAIRSMWGGSHRMEHAVTSNTKLPHNIMRQPYFIYRMLVITGLGIWIALAIYILLPRNVSNFIQVSCEGTIGSNVFKYFFILPFVLFGILAKEFGTPGAALAGLPIALLVLSWVIPIWRCCSEIRKKGTFTSLWQIMYERYPFIHFATTVVLPFGYWVFLVEVGVMMSNDNTWSITFGQVLAVFVALPPFIQVMPLIPRCHPWFRGLTWVRILID
ncbi:hypothetical protein BU17DRAFT_59222 [Hysterangium stoloniferum]|nr:hypothetical protein BU17DRAFT_59222 [Hysterangium stoloniferum]